MGADIHMIVEIKNPQTNKWEKVGKIFDNPYYRPGEENRVDDDGYEWNAKLTDSPYINRNYNLFGILANVRNGIGFAGIKTGEGFNPISKPKGIPSNASKEAKKFLKKYGIDGHSHSYFTIQELLDYDWNQYTMHRGYVQFKEFKRYKKAGENSPQEWCGDTSGYSVVKIEENTAEKYLGKKGLPIEYQDKDVYVNAHWTEAYHKSAGHFYTETLPALQKLGDPNNVRILFFFDN